MSNLTINRFFYICLVIAISTLSGCDRCSSKKDIPEAMVDEVVTDADAVPAMENVIDGTEGLGDVNAPVPNCPPGQMQSGPCERVDLTAQCMDDEGNVIGTVECEQVTCYCSGSQTERHAIRGIAACGECPRGSTPQTLPPINVVIPE